MSATGIAKADWPTFGLDDDVHPALAAARESRQSAVLVTLYAAMGNRHRGHCGGLSNSQ
jgi:hypothetical protein